jgi:hypothetical protein
VVVVENYGQFARDVGELVEKRACQRPDRRRSRRTERGENPLPESVFDRPERGHQVERKRAGSLFPSSSDTQATERSDERSATHSPSRVILPKPAGAVIRVSLRPGSLFRLSIRRGRATNFGRACGTRTLVDTSESDVRETWLTSGAYSNAQRTSTTTF